LPVSLKVGDEVEVFCSDDRDQSISRRRATLDGPVEGKEDSFDFHLVGGVYRTQRRQFFRKEISLPLRYRLEGDFYRVGFAADISGGGVRIQNVASSAKVGGRIQIELRLPGVAPPLAIDGEIVWMKTPPGGGAEIALAFRQISPHDQSRLIMFLFGETVKGRL
ncbi:MAG TPA: PilZ domain-containing protein, partial [Chroococcales cyanobacterium]